MAIELKTGFSCNVCGEHHDVLPLSYSVKAPLAAAAVPVDELEQRVVITPDQCVIDGRDFYLRGRIPVPVLGLEESFIWGVWVEVSPKDFIRTNDLWNAAGRETEPPFRGWLNSELVLFGDTINLEVSVQTQIVGRRPHFTVVDQDHPLAIEQSNGITIRRAEEIAEQILHAATL
ncbi:DUF2199 domain-containing protein [Granulicella sp. dw_53]|uniref:DUF2199 domain-containing protein n=1 Tax=Granulicella sp. dw_53 TaxID=2719792 RepID=UPI001BD61EAE|nr:DUF2199 domain-containing protein [Granulicella sp. dw_53]